MDIDPLDQATSILGEHFKNYVVIVQEDEFPLSYDLRYSDPYATKGLLEACSKYHATFLEGGETSLVDYEWIEGDEEDDEEDDE